MTVAVRVLSHCGGRRRMTVLVYSLLSFGVLCFFMYLRLLSRQIGDNQNVNYSQENKTPARTTSGGASPTSFQPNPADLEEPSEVFVRPETIRSKPGFESVKRNNPVESESEEPDFSTTPVSVSVASSESNDDVTESHNDEVVMNDEEAVDVIYTWVDGSDPAFQERRRPYGTTDGAQPKRFANHDELKYSLRSIEQNMPWIRRVFILTDHQTPKWLQLDHPRVTILSHQDVFANLDALPTFNPFAIEANMLRANALARRVISFNDDMFAGNTLTRTDLLPADGSHLLFLETNLLVITKPRHGGPPPPPRTVGGVAHSPSPKRSPPNLDSWVPTNIPRSPVRTAGGPTGSSMEPPVRNPDYQPMTSEQVQSMADDLEKRLRTEREERLERGRTEYEQAMQEVNERVAQSMADISAQRGMPQAQGSSGVQRSRRTGRKLLGVTEWDALSFSSMLLDKRFGFRARAYVSHVPRVYDREIFAEIAREFADGLAQTSTKRFRSPDDVHMPFLYAHYIRERYFEELFRGLVASKELDTDQDGFLDEPELTRLRLAFGETKECSKLDELLAVTNRVDLSSLQDFGGEVAWRQCLTSDAFTWELAQEHGPWWPYRTTIGTLPLGFVNMRMMGGYAKALRDLTARKPVLFCINDDEEIHRDLADKVIREFLAGYFSQPSSFEVAELTVE